MAIEGAFPPVTTPFDDNGGIVHSHLAENIKRWNETGAEIEEIKKIFTDAGFL